MSFKPEETYVIHNIVDPRPVQRTGLQRPLTLVNDANSYAKWIITNNGDRERYVIQNAATNCYADLQNKAAIVESSNPLTRWKIKVVSPSMYRIYDPVSQLFWTTHGDSNEVGANLKNRQNNPLNPSSDLPRAIFSRFRSVVGDSIGPLLRRIAFHVGLRL
ncbi:hypothetical protein D9756_002726 [Leucocoprinus leucothites]|uniref:Ricin B lectin domain-containing protein n=1 Tax=Leucocoprinus leucothites TaxID=201217 RepID=A0A8H5LLW8_9AGAR|nr:hypothetical protein D9756_002726 [Leucoagaricus leucothites]